MSAFDKAWTVLKDDFIEDERDPNDPEQRQIVGWGPGDKNNPHGLPQYADSDDPVNDAHEHFYGGENDFDLRRALLAQEVSAHLRNVWDSYKDGHPEWDNPRPGKDGPPGADTLSALIEEMANEHGAQLPW
tara:strand:- start:162 stop:554 length:393 start_codon:yes stop_codon:yes gene_type:complete